MADKENQVQGVVDALLKGMDTVLSTKTVVGEPTQIGDTIILPLVDVSFGIGAGAGNNNQKGSSQGAGGMGGKMTPSAILVLKNGSARLVNIKNKNTVNKIIDMVPDLLDRFTQKKSTSDGQTVTDEEAREIAFPEKEDSEKEE